MKLHSYKFSSEVSQFFKKLLIPQRRDIYWFILFISATVVNGVNGNRVKSTINTTIPVTTAFTGNHTEWDVASSSLTRYYYAGSTRVAMRKNNTVYYLLSDHLGSTSLTMDQNGQNPVKQYYLPWGEVRYSSGSLPTKYTYTGQYSNVSDFGLMYYNARWYDSALSRFTSADTIVPQPGNPLDWDRYSYVRNSPINFTDPSGHCVSPSGQIYPNQAPYGESGPCPSQIMLPGWDASYGQEQVDNDCATTSIAVGISILNRSRVEADLITRLFESSGWKIDGMGVLPRTQAAGLNALDIGVSAAFFKGTRQDLIENIIDGYVTLVTVSWKEWKYYGHVMTVIGFNFDEDQLIFWDPGKSMGFTNENDWMKGISEFEQAWLNQRKPGIPPGSMVMIFHSDPINLHPFRGGGGGWTTNSMESR